MDDSISSSNSNLMSIVLIYVSTFAVGSLIIVCLTIYCCCQFRLRQKLREMRKLRKKRKTRSSAEFDILPRLVTDEEASAGGIGGDKKASASAKSKKTEFSDTGGKSKASLVSASSMTSRAAINTSFRKKKITFEKLKEKSRSMKSKSGKIPSEALVHANLDGRQSPPANVTNESSFKSPMTSGTISKNTQD